MDTLKDHELLSTIPETTGFEVMGPSFITAGVGNEGMGAGSRGHRVNLDEDIAVKISSGAHENRSRPAASSGRGSRRTSLIALGLLLILSGTGIPSPWAGLDSTEGPHAIDADASRLLDWATVLEEEPDPKVVTDPAFLAKLKALDLPWRVRDNLSGVEMLLIAPGDYLRGSPDTEVGRDPRDEGPVHSVKISEPLYVGRYEVRVAEWRNFVKATEHRTEAETSGEGFTLKADGSDWIQDKDATWANPLPLHDSFKLLDGHPVVMVSFNDVTAFTKWSKLRLLTEAEWEYVARAGTKTSRWFGDANPDGNGCGNFADKSLLAMFPTSGWTIFPFDDRSPLLALAGKYKPNAWALQDTLGSALEWCSDVYKEDEYQLHVKGVTDPKGPPEDTGFRVLRGGSWLNPPSNVRAAYRIRNALSNANVYVGFRVARPPR